MAGAFIRKQVDTVGSKGGSPTAKYAGIHIVDKDADSSAYQFDYMQGSQAGTRVPQSRKRGGIEGSNNPHGTVILGNKVTVDREGGGFVSMGELEPVAGLEDAVTPEEEPEEIYEDDEEDEGVELAADISADMEAFQTYTPPAVLPSPEEYLHNRPAPAKPAVKKKRVSLTGSFGTFRGKYTHIHETGDLVVLLYDPEDPAYTPPSSNDPITISCGKHSHKVYFPGIEFELDFLGQGIQVFVKSE